VPSASYATQITALECFETACFDIWNFALWMSRSGLAPAAQAIPGWLIVDAHHSPTHGETHKRKGKHLKNRQPISAR
jgi:hypothetical protein